MTGTLHQANVIICPKCNHYFENNMVNGLALIDTIGRIDSRKQMYCRLILDDMERLVQANIFTFQKGKKIILDSLNDLNRDIQTILGYGLEVE